MRIYIIAFVVIVAFIIACKSKNKSVNTRPMFGTPEYQTWAVADSTAKADSVFFIWHGVQSKSPEGKLILQNEEARRKADSAAAEASFNSMVDSIIAVMKADSLAHAAAFATGTSRITVSVFSKGSGIDGQLKLRFDDLIALYEANNKVTIPVNRIPWGREGEIDYCFNLSSLPKAVADDFIRSVIMPHKGVSLINIIEGADCRVRR